MQRTVAGQRYRVTAGSLISLLVLACGDSTAPLPPVETVEVTPSVASREVGQTVQLSATVKDASGNILSGRAVTWSSTANAVASVSASGLVTAASLGTVTITAAVGNKSGVATIDVIPPPIANISLSTTNDTLLVGETLQISATMRDQSNNIVTGRTAAWTSTSPNVASVSSSGVVTGVADGVTTVTASADGKSASATIRVFGPCSTALAPAITVGQTINGALASTDCKLSDGTYADGYFIQVASVTNVQIDMTAAFDTYLVLLELLPDGTLAERAFNDDLDPDDPADPNDPVNTNSRITFALQPGLQYFILANSFDPDVVGDYQLKVTATAFVAGSSVAGKPGKAPVKELLKAIRTK